MNSKRYSLEKYTGSKSRFDCPKCEHKKEFTKYIDTETNQYINDLVGKCNRLKCDYHFSPKQYFDKNNITNEYTKNTNFRHVETIKKEISYIDKDLFKSSLKQYENNNFILSLNNLFGIEKTTKAIENYFIGTSKRWDGACIFWQIDLKANVRTGKIMLYDTGTCKRVKTDNLNKIDWVHTELKKKNNVDFNLEQCFFGEHLLNDLLKDVCIVESEKTAIICSIVYPDKIWIATGGAYNFTFDKCKVLKGRNVLVFPDLDNFDKWSLKVNTKEFKELANFSISNYLKTVENITDKDDLADHLLKCFKEQKSTKGVEKTESTLLEQIEKLESDLIGIGKSKQPLSFKYGIITDIDLYINTNLSIIKHNIDNRNRNLFNLSFQRLLDLKDLLSSSTNSII